MSRWQRQVNDRFAPDDTGTLNTGETVQLGKHLNGKDEWKFAYA